MVWSRAGGMRSMCFQLESGSSLEADIVLDISVTSRTERGMVLRGTLLTTNAFSANRSLSLRTTVCGMDASPVRGTFFILNSPAFC